MPNTYVSRLRLLSAVFLLVTAGGLQAQLSSTCSGGNDNGNFSISIDTVATNIGVLTDLTGAQIDLTGFSTYRLYLQCESSNDLLQAVGGDSNVPVTISTTTSFYQAQFGSAIESNPGLIAVYPQVEYDSYVTIGLFETAVAADGEAATSLTEDNAVFPVSIGFENGNDLIIDSFTGSSWYVADAEAASNCIAGDDLKVLFAQVTTDGDIDGDVQFQVYRNGLQQAENCLRPYLPINPLNQPGCTDPAACNYDASAFVDNGSCDFCSCADTTLFSTVSFPNDSLSQYSLDIDVYANHDTTGFPELAGMKTYRMYINMAEANDKLTAVYGNDETPLDIQSTAPFYQDALGAVTPNSILEFYFDIFPTVVYDSWVTIGIDRAPQDFGTGYSDVFTASDPNQSTTWMADFDPGAGVSGSNILANTNVGGIWSVTNPTVQNGVPDENQRVLIGQFTTGGIITGSIAVQIIPETLPADDDEYRLTFEFTTDNLGDLNVSVNGSPVNEEECGCLSDSDADGICDSSDNCSDISACNFDSPENDTCQTLDILGVCGGGCTADTDNDEICDDIDPCVGTVDECGVCNGEGAVFECGCLPLLPSWCDCNGNTLDALGVCGGDCAADDNNNNICDADEVTGCQDDTACNYNAAANMPGACAYASGCNTCSGETDGTGIVVDNDSDDDGVCDANEVSGCTDATACNYDSTPTTDTDNTLCTYVDGVCDTCVNGLIVDNDSDNDGVCDANEVTGCTDPTACNYDSTSTTDTDNTLCTYVDGVCETCEAGLIVDNDSDDDGVCDANEVTGCTDPTACNYDSTSTTDTDNTLCTYVDGVCETCEGGLIVDNDTDNDNVCDADEVPGCTDATACNYNPEATDSDGTCTFEDGICETCENGLIVDNDSDDDGVCDADEVTGCTDPTACNYDSTPTTDTDNTLCTYVDGVCETCVNGQVVDNDSDEDGVCDADEVTGCTDPTACNYDSTPTTDTDNTLCTYVDGDCETCENGLIVDNDSDDDGVCDADEVTGCTDPTACNYDSTPTTDTDNTLCTYVDGVCETCVNGQVVDNDSDEDGVCDADEVTGCTDPTACNYDSTPTTDTDNTLCTYVDGVCETCENGLIVDNDSDEDGVCDADEVTGCTDPTACNYDSTPTTDTDNTLCTYVDGVCETCVNGQVVDNDSDEDGVCDADEVTGCTDPTACNYDSTPTTDTDNTLCTYIDGDCETCENGLIVDNDSDDDGVCDADEVTGCTDPTACNYDSTPTTDTDNTLCTYVDGDCETCENGLIVDNDSDEDGVCDADEVTGCTDPTACNYDSTPTTDTDNTLCTYVDGDCETCENGLIVDNDSDDDGVCDADEVTGCTDPTACNYDSTPTTDTDNTLCTYVDGVCETCENGLIVDNDSDEDGVCDADEVTGCTDPTACNYDSTPTTDTDNTLCTYVDGVCETCENGLIVDNDSDEDGVCDADEVTGCTDPTACNYDSTPTTDTDNTLCTYIDGDCETCENGLIVDNDSDDDGVCNANEVTGCTDPTACNYDSTPTTDTDNTLCTYVDGVCETCVNGQVVDNDSDEDGVCDADEVTGCTDPTACNYDSTPTTDTDNTLCTYVDGVCETCENGLIVDNDSDDDGVCNANEVTGCTDPTACNYDSTPTTDTDNTLCTYVDGVCETCLNGLVIDNDIDNDGVCDADETAGCTDPEACNAGNFTDTDNSLCTYVDGVCETCQEGVVVDNDSDDDGVCNANEVTGCTDPTACNYDSTPTTDTDNTLCTYVDGVCETCVNGQVVDNDSDEDGVCDADEVTGCTDPTACNYDSTPTTDTDNTLCTYVDGDCETCENGLIVDNDSDEDGVCDADEVTGCTDPTACNYDSTPTTDTDNTLCTYVDGDCETCENGLIVDNDSDDDGVCDADEVTGCTDPTACNYDSTPTTDTDNTLCTYVDGDCETCVNGQVVDNDSDEDGVCDADEVTGCTDPTACNYDSTPTTDTDNTLCTYVDGDCETCENGQVVDNDSDEDGVCDADEVTGCTNPTACNYDSTPTTDTDNTLCTYVDGDCETCENGLIVDNDSDEDGVCDADEVTGCTDPTACNYDSTPTTDTDNTLCTYVDGDCETCENGQVVDNDSDDDGVCDANEVSGCTDNTACNYEDTATESDDSCLYEDALGECGGICLSDLDNDGICDNDDACVGLYDALGICNGTCPADLDNDDICDTEDPCVGDYDVLGICNGDCTADEDEDGICDDVDPCVGSLDALNVCNGDCPADVDEDGVCDNAEIFGCTDENACNYNSIATEEDSSCAYLDVLDECGGSCTADLDNDGICDDVDACVGSYDALGDCNGGCTADIDDDGVCDDEDPCVGTPDALGVCNGDCPSDADQDGVCDNAEILGCDDTAACNYDPVATENDGSCTTLDALDECGGDCTADADNDGICDDVDPCIGALDAIGVCNGDCTADIDGDGVCDSSELLGCTDENACNYNVNATEEDGSCTVEDAIGVCGGDCPCDQNNNGICDGEELACPDFNNNGICDGAEIFGCTYSGACNYQEEATVDDGSCTYTLPGFDCEGNDLNTSELFYGCTYEAAINYSAAADIDNGSCIFLDAITDIGPCYFDITNDGVVNTPDLLILLQYWEATCDE